MHAHGWLNATDIMTNIVAKRAAEHKDQSERLDAGAPTEQTEQPKESQYNQGIPPPPGLELQVLPKGQYTENGEPHHMDFWTSMEDTWANMDDDTQSQTQKTH